MMNRPAGLMPRDETGPAGVLDGGAPRLRL